MGFISFGGPAGQISIMHQELVERRRWISEKRFLHALNYCMLLPGPEAQQLATYLGWLMHRSLGGLIAGVLFVLPSLLLLVLLSWVYLVYGDVPWVAGLFYGIKPAVTAIVVQAAYRIGSKTLKNAFFWSLAAGAFVAIFALKLPFPLIVLLAGVFGYLAGRVRPDWFEHGKTEEDPDTSTPGQLTVQPGRDTRFRWSRTIILVMAGALCWLVPMGLLWGLYGWNHTFTQMSWFFTKAALLTFGGAYAVLPYVYQGAVSHFGWLSPTQMIDGLALGESTPGPLIMVVVFVAFLGGWGSQPLGSENLFLAGLVCALLVTWFTFLPSFLFILIGAPLVESTHGRLSFSAPLAGITAAVVGVIINLAVFFAYHVLWPEGFSGAPDLLSLAICLGALAALIFARRGVIEVLTGCALLGLLSTAVSF